MTPEENFLVPGGHKFSEACRDVSGSKGSCTFFYFLFLPGPSCCKWLVNICVLAVFYTFCLRSIRIIHLRKMPGTHQGHSLITRCRFNRIDPAALLDTSWPSKPVKGYSVCFCLYLEWLAGNLALIFCIPNAFNCQYN